jgi:hypothetical protein
MCIDSSKFVQRNENPPCIQSLHRFTILAFVWEAKSWKRQWCTLPILPDKIGLLNVAGLEKVVGKWANAIDGVEHQPNDGAVIAPKPPLFAALSSGFMVPFSIGQSLEDELLAYTRG